MDISTTSIFEAWKIWRSLTRVCMSHATWKTLLFGKTVNFLRASQCWILETAIGSQCSLPTVAGAKCNVSMISFSHIYICTSFGTRPLLAPEFQPHFQDHISCSHSSTVTMTIMITEDSPWETRNSRFDKEVSKSSSARAESSTAIWKDYWVFCFFHGRVSFSVETFQWSCNVRSSDAWGVRMIVGARHHDLVFQLSNFLVVLCERIRQMRLSWCPSCSSRGVCIKPLSDRGENYFFSNFFWLLHCRTKTKQRSRVKDYFRCFPADDFLQQLFEVCKSIKSIGGGKQLRRSCAASNLSC